MSNSASSRRGSNRCRAQAKSGKLCRAAATAGGLCYFHANPKKASELGRKGGRSKKRQPTSEGLIGSLPALDNQANVIKLIDYLIEMVHDGKLLPQQAKVIESLLRLRSQVPEVDSYEDGDVPASQGATVFEVIEAEWLRDKRRELAEECEKKHADKFPKDAK